MLGKTKSGNRGETARVHWESARQEAIQRVALRDRALMACMAAAATLFGVVYSTTISKALLLAVPYIAFGAALIASQHNAVIGGLGSYCVGSYKRTLKNLKDQKIPKQTPKIRSLNLQKLKKNCLLFPFRMTMMSWRKKWPTCSMKTA